MSEATELKGLRADRNLGFHRDREWFEAVYSAYNHREFIHPDPLKFVVRFGNPADQEIAGLVAATLAFGRVGHILNSLETVFRILESPAVDVAAMSHREMKDAFGAFRHRWATGGELANLLHGVKRLRDEHGSLEDCFAAGIGDGDENVIPSLTRFVAAVKSASGGSDSSLLSCPTRGSACKRLLLYLRWMVRRDDVDPGPWTGISPSMLVVPMDTHMQRICRAIGLTSRRQADMKSALEVTGFFRTMCPEDPVRYDFALTRPGIRREPDITGILNPLRANPRDFC